MNSSDNYQLFIKDFLYFCDMRKLIFSLLVSVAAYAAAETPDIPAASPDSTAATAPVSYTHLTLPTKLEV